MTVTRSELMNNDFMLVFERSGAIFSIWRRSTDGRIIAFDESSGEVYMVDDNGFGSEPIALSLFIELSDIIRQLGNATLSLPSQQTALLQRLRNAVPLTQISDPSVLGL